MAWQTRDMCLDDFEDEEIVLVDQRIVEKLAFEVGVTFANERRTDIPSRLRRQRETGKLVDLSAGRVADADHCVGQRRYRQVDDALSAPAHQAEAVVCLGDAATD